MARTNWSEGARQGSQRYVHLAIAAYELLVLVPDSQTEIRRLETMGKSGNERLEADLLRAVEAVRQRRGALEDAAGQVEDRLRLRDLRVKEPYELS